MQVLHLSTHFFNYLVHFPTRLCFYWVVYKVEGVFLQNPLHPPHNIGIFQKKMPTDKNGGDTNRVITKMPNLGETKSLDFFQEVRIFSIR